LAGGALLTYAWTGFPETPVLPVDPTVDLIGNAVFAAGALVLLFFAVRRVQAEEAARATRTAPRGRA
jgi:hypothetical protein